jgi:protease-4
MSERKRRRLGHLLGRLLGGIVLPVQFLLWGLARLAFGLRQKRRLRPHTWPLLELEGQVLEQVEKSRLAKIARSLLGLEDQSQVVLSEVRDLVQTLSESRCGGLIVTLGPLDCGWSQAAELRGFLRRLTERHKPVLLLIRSFAGNREMLIASGASKVYALPASHIGAVGASSTALFFQETLERAGISIEASSAGRYKSAIEPFTRTERSEADREQTQAIIEQLDQALIEAVAESRKVGLEGATDLIDAAPYTGSQAKAAGWIDDALDEETLAGVAQEMGGSDKSIQMPPASRFLGVESPPKAFAAWGSRKRVGIVEVRGAILESESPFAYLDDQAVSRVVVRDLRAALSDDDIGAVVLYVSSRGGGVAASDQIYGAVRRLNESKPVIACFGDVAASGGYYVGCGARAIVASPLTITGSIGVFQTLPTIQELAGRLSLRHDTLGNRRHSSIYSALRPQTEEERAHTKAQVTALYGSFVRLVASARDKPEEEIQTVAEGRVWTGRDALHGGLVDGLGGMEEAIERAQEAAGGRFHTEPELVHTSKSKPLPGPAQTSEAALAMASLIFGTSVCQDVARELLAVLGTTRGGLAAYAALAWD